jgi:hypothetical protein
MRRAMHLKVFIAPADTNRGGEGEMCRVTHLWIMANEEGDASGNASYSILRTGKPNH